ncbi:MAG: n-acetylglutamate synthase [Bacteroidota bacterium]
MNFNLNNKSFKSKENAETGEVGEGTIFHYFQEENIIWAFYEGGKIVRGQIIGKVVSKSAFEISYQHINLQGKIKTGICHTNLSTLPNGKIQLNEKWKWTCDDFSEGESILVEIANK